MKPSTPSGGVEDHPEFIPTNHENAYQRIGHAVVEGLQETSDTTFLKAWWALCWLHPALHPDDHRQWPRSEWREFASEAFRRFDTGKIRDHELYPAEVIRNQLWRARLADRDGSSKLHPISERPH